MSEVVTCGRVLVVGDANPDLVMTGDVLPRFGQAEQLLDRAELVLGGSAAIAACGLARLGVQTALAAMIGDDVFGRFVSTALDTAAVRTDWVRVAAEPTGLSVILDIVHDRSILTRPGTIAMLTADQVRTAVEAWQPSHVHVASFFLQPRLAAELPELLSWLRSRGGTVSLDTNADPAGSWSGLDEVLPYVDVLLPNWAEALAIAVALSGHPIANLDQAVMILTGYGPRVVIKNGAAGGLAYGAEGLIASVPGLAVDVVDTTGAGDSFDAGYLAALLGGVEDEPTRLRRAAAAGSLSTRGAGGTGRQADRAELLARITRRWTQRDRVIDTV